MVYRYIVNPETGRECRVDTALGKRIIKNYVNAIAGAGKNKRGGGRGSRHTAHSTGDARSTGAAEGWRTVNIEVDKRLLKLGNNKAQAQNLLNKMAMTLYGKPISECLGKAQNLVKGSKKLRVIVHLPPNLSEDKSVVDKMIAEKMRESHIGWDGKKVYPTWRYAAEVVEGRGFDRHTQQYNSYQAIIRMESIANHHNREAGEGSTVFVSS